MRDRLRAWGLRLRALWRKAAVERDLDEEVRFHVEMETERLVREGSSPEAARREALRRFGGVERYKEQARDARGTRLVEDGMQDVRYGLRMLAKNPVFTTVAILTLALGIGANTAIYTLVDAVLLEPLPFDEAEELTLLWTENREQNQTKYFVSPLDFDDWRSRNTTFESMAAYWPTTTTITELDGGPARARTVYTTQDFFRVLGVGAMAGRTFTDEEGPGSTPVAILSEGFWERRYGRDPSVLGSAIPIDGSPHEVVGVIRGDRVFPEGTDVWINMTWPMQIQTRSARWMSAVGRRNDGVGPDAAQADMSTLAARLAEENPDTNRGWDVSTASLEEELVGDTRLVLWVLLSATGLILLIACANVANLLLSRAGGRAREIAVRVAFGAGRARLARQLVTESLILSGLGALAGLGLAHLGVRGLLSIAPVTLPRGDYVDVDGTVLLVVLATSVLSGLLFGLAPLARLVRPDIHETIKHAGRGAGSDSGRRLQSTFAVLQLALAMMLVVGAGLLARSFGNIRSVDPGFSSDGVLTLELDLPGSVAEDDQAVLAFYEQYEQRLAELPGVESVGLASTLPLDEDHDYYQYFDFAERPAPSDGDRPRAYLRQVSPDFFETMRTPVVAGRGFTRLDRAESPGVALVNEAFVRLFFDDESPLGARLTGTRYRMGPLGLIIPDEAEIVGVVQDVKYAGLRGASQPSIYFSYLQAPFRRMTLTLRTRGDLATLTEQARQALADQNPTLALAKVQPLDSVVSAARSRDRFGALLLGLFALLALVLASIGVYGVLASAVAERRGEVGIRMALGAEGRNIRSMILLDGARLVVWGVVLGGAGALALSGVLASQLYGVEPRDPTVLGTVTAVLAAVGLAASYLPALRATRVSPTVAMRAE